MTRKNSPQDAEIILQKLPSDMGIHRNPRKGTLNAPDEILDEFSTDRRVLIEEVFPDEFSLEETHQKISRNTEDLVNHGKPLLSIGGDHSVSFQVLKALKEKFPNLKLVWLDSHLDVKEKVDEHISHDVVVRELLDHGFSLDEIYFVGTTRIDEDEESFLEDKDPQIYRPDELEKFLREFDSGEHPVYLSVDIDVLREEEAPGTGYPDGKLELEEVLDLIEKISPNHTDLVEVAPPFDQGNITVENARKILDKILEELD
ncbi:MAG: arginase family protein [Candidatus Nanosalina sp.]